ncbi:MAG: hypothetical protein H0V41_17300 [Pseudonocardiales bacterium]|nr:hypothetical protein [Pseudonocardiales bacterium]
MILTVLTVVVIALLIAALAIFLFTIGVQLNRTADNLDDCAQNVKNIAQQAGVIGPGVVRINETGTTVIGALPLLCDGAEQIGVAKGAPYIDPEAPYSPLSAARTTVTSEAPAPAPAPAPSAAPVAAPVAVGAPSPQGVGYLDDGAPRGTLGAMDA